MSFYALRFNLYLLLLAAIPFFTGCKTDKTDNKKQMASLRVYVANRAQMKDSGQTVTVLRSEPVQVTINDDPILTEADVTRATLLETPGGFAIEMQFDDQGTLILEQFTSANPGGHLVVFSQWSDQTKDSRWIAAPLISHRIADGVLSFTPDASRDEAKLIVTGVNHMAEKLAKEKMK